MGCYGLFRRKDVLNTVEANAEALIAHIEDELREKLASLVKMFSVQYILAWVVTESAGSGQHRLEGNY